MDDQRSNPSLLVRLLSFTWCKSYFDDGFNNESEYDMNRLMIHDNHQQHQQQQHLIQQQQQQVRDSHSNTALMDSQSQAISVIKQAENKVQQLKKDYYQHLIHLRHLRSQVSTVETKMKQVYTDIEYSQKGLERIRRLDIVRQSHSSFERLTILQLCLRRIAFIPHEVFVIIRSYALTLLERHAFLMLPPPSRLVVKRRRRNDIEEQLFLTGLDHMADHQHQQQQQQHRFLGDNAHRGGDDDNDQEEEEEGEHDNHMARIGMRIGTRRDENHDNNVIYQTPDWNLTTGEHPSTLLHHVRCYVEESRYNTLQGWTYKMYREPINGIRTNYHDGKAFWLSARSRTEGAWRTVYDISIIDDGEDGSSSESFEAGIIARLVGLNASGTRWQLIWVHGGPKRERVLMGVIFKRNLLRNHPTVFEVVLNTSSSSSTETFFEEVGFNGDASAVLQYSPNESGSSSTLSSGAHNRISPVLSQDGNHNINSDLRANKSSSKVNNNKNNVGQEIDFTKYKAVSFGSGKVDLLSSSSSSLSALANASAMEAEDFEREARTISELSKRLPSNWQCFKSLEAIWNGENYTLNFGNRVLVASARNCQLVNILNPALFIRGDHANDRRLDAQTNAVTLQFGRVTPSLSTGKNRFSLDFTAPFSPLQAFAVSLAVSNRKICC